MLSLDVHHGESRKSRVRFQLVMSGSGRRTSLQGTITLIVPSYNHAGFIRDCIRSLLSQTRPADEIIVVDDGSTDGTPAILQEFAPNVALHLNKHMGLRQTVAMGLSIARGDYVLVIGSDDVLLPHACAVLGAILDKQADVALAYGDVDFIDETGERIGQGLGHGPVGKHRDTDLLVTDNYIPAPSALCRRDALLEIGEPQSVACGDWERWLMLSLTGRSFYGVRDRIALYRRHGKNLSHASGGPRLLEEGADMLARLATYVASSNTKTRRSLLKSSGSRYRTAGWSRFAHHAYKHACVDFLQSIRLPGRRIKDVAGLVVSSTFWLWELANSAWKEFLLAHQHHPR